MKKQETIIAVLFAFLFIVSSAAMAAVSGSREAVVTIVEGIARVIQKDALQGRLLKRGDRLKHDDEIRVERKSRVEIRLPDGSIMRLAEKSRLKMNELQYDRKTEGKKMKVDLAIGKLWAKIRKLVTPDSSVEVKTVNAVAGVRGTVYRVNVEEDQSALVRVYDGTVYVANPPRSAADEERRVTMPHEVSGPHEVPPPYHEVTMEEWTAIVKAMQQISISPEGKPSKPEDFDPKTDANDWVKWNQERDRHVDF